jgi:hypothetical protein
MHENKIGHKMQHEKFYNIHKAASGKVQFMLSKSRKDGKMK